MIPTAAEEMRKLSLECAPKGTELEIIARQIKEACLNGKFSVEVNYTTSDEAVSIYENNGFKFAKEVEGITNKLIISW